jgi:diamine N-acetyltransferase
MLRRAGPADAATVAALGAATFIETFGHLYAPEDLAGFLGQAHSVARAHADLTDPRCAIWLLEAAGEALGYVLAGPCDLPHPEAGAGDGEIKRLYLLAGAQSGGWGGRLFDAAVAWLQAEGPRAVWIGVWSENHGAQRFYARRGFVKVGEYGFNVGKTTDHEFILRRDAESFSNNEA